MGAELQHSERRIACILCHRQSEDYLHQDCTHYVHPHGSASTLAVAFVMLELCFSKDINVSTGIRREGCPGVINVGCRGSQRSRRAHLPNLVVQVWLADWAPVDEWVWNCDKSNKCKCTTYEYKTNHHAYPSDPHAGSPMWSLYNSKNSVRNVRR